MTSTGVPPTTSIDHLTAVESGDRVGARLAADDKPYDQLILAERRGGRGHELRGVNGRDGVAAESLVVVGREHHPLLGIGQVVRWPRRLRCVVGAASDPYEGQRAENDEDRAERKGERDA